MYIGITSEKSRSQRQIYENGDPGPIGFTSGFSREHKYSTVGAQITVEQLTELSIVMSISRQ